MALADLTPRLEPIDAFHDADAVERQFKEMTFEIFRAYFRTLERDLNTYGAPHLGSFDQVERRIKSDGLDVVRGNSQEAMRYLFKAWKARNPKRGLHFLRTYLQLLWPGGWRVDQLWQKKADAYPTSLYTDEELLIAGVADKSKDYFLTSRINIGVIASNESSIGLDQVSKSLRAACGAKFVVGLQSMRSARTDLVDAGTLTSDQFIDAYGSLA